MVSERPPTASIVQDESVWWKRQSVEAASTSFRMDIILRQQSVWYKAVLLVSVFSRNEATV
jgi:hypothetical protein